MVSYVSNYSLDRITHRDETSEAIHTAAIATIQDGAKAELNSCCVQLLFTQNNAKNECCRARAPAAAEHKMCVPGRNKRPRSSVSALKSQNTA